MGIVGMLVGISVVGACLAEAEIQIKGEINKAKKIVKIVIAVIVVLILAIFGIPTVKKWVK